ncbi:zinc-binding dehydrogenase [Pseudonocardia ailaonensis]|uniref:Zinc-binding dehydrogenase n=1 Tax=Pseudonocardia ailaonensis TaxID=367279 RepID=A0ABN2NNR0_9PSEU
MKARAAVMVAPGKMEVRELEVPADPPSGGAIVRITANGLCGVDYELFHQLIPAKIEFPIIAGHEMVGEIVKLDPEAARAWGVAEGDRVAIEPNVYCGACRNCISGRGRFCRNLFRYSLEPVDSGHGLWGGMAEYMVLVKGTRVTKVPRHVSDRDAGLFNVFGNAFDMAGRVGQVGLGDRVLILGPGQRGLGCAAVAAEAGAAQIIVTGLDRDAHKLALAPEFGATDVIRVEQDETVERVMELTDGQGVDLVIDTVPGATDPILDGVAALRSEGTLVLSGVKGREITGLSPDVIFLKALTIKGAFATTPWATANSMRLLAGGRYPFDKLHSHAFGLDDVERAIGILGGDVDDPTPVVHITIEP